MLEYGVPPAFTRREWLRRFFAGFFLVPLGMVSGGTLLAEAGINLGEAVALLIVLCLGMAVWAKERRWKSPFVIGAVISVTICLLLTSICFTIAALA